MMPYPFARAIFVWGPPLWVSETATEADLEEARAELEKTLNRMTEEAESAVTTNPQ